MVGPTLNVLEVEAVLFALHHFLPSLQECHVPVRTDINSLHQQAGGLGSPAKQAGDQTLGVASSQFQFDKGSVCAWTYQPGNRFALRGRSTPMGVETSP